MTFDQTDFQYLGAIVRIRIRNFMTYTDAELRPGPNLNIILGPNGTGKSAVVCCIIVGLAGEVALTGRGASPADFVKKHQTTATTEIELYNDNGKNFIVERIINITKQGRSKNEHVSEWKINGKKALKGDVKDLTKRLNIKVDNLCQFLPQDSVTQFVKMNSCELLVNTLKAAGDNTLVEDHQKLIEFTKDVEAKRAALTALEKSRQENEVNAKRLESEVVQLRQREGLIKEKKLCSQKMIYLQYMEALTQEQAFKESRDRVLEEYKRAEMNTDPSKLAMKVRADMDTKAKEALRRSQGLIPQTKDKVEATKEKLTDLKQKCQKRFSDFKVRQNEEAHRAREIKVRQQEICTLESKYDEYKELECERKLESLEKEMNVVREGRKKNLNDKRETEAHLKNTVNDMDRIQKERDQILKIKDKKLQLLQSRNRDAVVALEWLNKNKDRFKKHVYTPILCEIDVKDPGNASIIENAIPRQELMSFVCQTKEDLQTFTRAARDEMKVRLSVVLAPTKTMEQFIEESRMDPNYLKSTGIDSFLKDLITAPDPIMRYLCANHNFHRIPIAKEDGAQFNILKEKFRKFYIGLTYYNITISRYDGQQVIGSERIRDAQLLQYSLDTQRLKQCEKDYLELRKKHDGFLAKQEEIASENTKLMEEWERYATKHRELSLKSEEKKRIETQIEKAREFIARTETEKIDIEAERAKLAKDIDVLNNSATVLLTKLIVAYQIYKDLRQNHMRSTIRAKLTKHNHTVARKNLARAEKDVVRLAEEVKKADTRLKTFKAARNECKKAAEERVPGFVDGRLDRKMQEKFNKIEENTVPQLKDKRDDLQVRISRIYHDANNGILNEYQRQNEQLKDKTEQIAELNTAIKKLETERQMIKKTWVPRLTDVIEAIDINYRNFMQKLCYDGQVKMDYNESDPENFSAYGIQILVKYRDNDNLIPLSSTRQSGGERSVATMIYMLALQTKTTVPFRCVDEINQGMDKDNERKVFELLIQTADSSSSQYFLVSPKLLNNLPYSEKMMIHVVFNGKNLVKGCWNSK